MIKSQYTNRGNYIFNEIAHHTQNYILSHHTPPIRIGVGDAVLPIAPCVATAMSRASMQLAMSQTFVGYGSEYGLAQYITAVANYYNSIGVQLDATEIFASDGAISQLCDILEIVDATTIAVPDPSYPVYRDNALLSNLKVVPLPNDNYLSALPQCDVDVVYLCNPTNPTGMCYNYTQLSQWIDYCNSTNTLLIYDSAYSCFAGDNPQSIYQIPHANKCAIEICSLSKSASFTGIRCGYTVVPHSIPHANKAWRTRLSYKTNGVSFISQMGGSAALSQEGLAHTKQCTQYYLDNVKLLRYALTDNLGLVCHGGTCSPYLWVSCPQGATSWQLFLHLLDNYGMVTLPGIGMSTTENYHIRVSGFCLKDIPLEVSQRLAKGKVN